MSQEETQSQATVIREGNRSGAALSRMMLGGRSFSGNERNCCFLNMGASPAAAGRFADISAVSGLDYPDDGRAVALADWDHDGDLDMWISNRNGPRLRLMRNDAPGGNHFLALRLAGNGETTNRDAIGARVEVVLANPQSEIENPKSIKTLRAGEGFLAQSSKWLHFGLGAADVVDKVIVHWPGGDVEEFTGTDVDHRYRLLQGSGAAQDATVPVRQTRLVASTQKRSPPTQAARIPMVELLAVPRSSYTGFDGKQHNLPTDSGRLLLVNLWGSWCAPCLVELSEFTRRHEQLRAAGIDILALSVDGLGSSASAEGKADAERLIAEAKFPFSVGLATSPLMTEFQELHDLQLALHQPLSIPSSLLIDRQGRLAVIYKGPVSVDQLLQDVVHSKGDRQERFARSAPIAGRSIQHPQARRTADHWAEDLLCYRGFRFEKTSRLDEAARQFADVLNFKPDSYMAHNDLGHVLHTLGRHAEAIDHFRQALQIKPDHAVAHANLGIAFQGQGRTTEAMDHLRQALRINPDYADAHATLGIALQGQGTTVEAIDHFRQALRLKPNDALTHNNLGIALQKQGKIAAAIDHFRRALRIGPESADAHIRLGIALHRQGKTVAAIEHFHQALRLQPDYALAHNNLGIALQKQGKIVEAVEHFQQALRIEPDYASVHARLGVVLSTQGDSAAAVRHFTRALKLKPKSPETLNNLAWLLATDPDAAVRDGAQAVELAQRCCQLTGHETGATLDTLAAAYAEAGRFEDAVRCQTTAVELASAADKAELEGRLELYKAGKPYREKS